MNVRIIGRGKLGRTLYEALRAAGHEVQLERGRSSSFPRSGGQRVFVLAVPDAQLRPVSGRILQALGKQDVVLHCAGSRGPDELSVCREQGAHVATLHPMVSFASARNGPNLQGTLFVTRGDARAVRAARWLAGAVGAHCVVGPAGTPAYHAAAAAMGNGGAALAGLTMNVLAALGLERQAARRAVAGMLRSVADNVERMGMPAALTGPIARGDADTIRAHVLALRRLHPTFSSLYASVGELILASATEAGLDPHAASDIRAALRIRSRSKRSPRRPE